MKTVTPDPFTMLAHIEVETPTASHAVAPPIYQTSTFWSDDAAEFQAMATEPMHPAFYTRYGNPTTRAFESAVAALEGGEAALATASGMGAMSVGMLANVGQGEHVIAQQVLYGGTTAWLKSLAPRLGIEVTFVDQTDTAAFADAVQKNTRMFILESPANPMMGLTDLSAVAAIAKACGAVTLVDNTIASPINQRPLSFGADLVMHSATKYLGGHSDLTAGVLVGSHERINAASEKANLLGATLDPMAAWLALRGLRTLPMRIARHNETALAIARRLTKHPSVCAVHYPGLEAHPQHQLALQQMSGFGGVLSFEVDGGMTAAERFVANLSLVRRSASFGSFSTLVVHPAAMWAEMLSPTQLIDAGLPPVLIRVGMGFECADAIWADMSSALSVM